MIVPFNNFAWRSDMAAMMMFSYVQENRFSDAVAQIDSWRRTSHNPSDWLDAETYVNGRWGRCTQAQRAFARLQQFMRRSQLNMPQPLLTAYLGTGRKDQAIALLQELYSKHRTRLSRSRWNQTLTRCAAIRASKTYFAAWGCLTLLATLTTNPARRDKHLERLAPSRHYSYSILQSAKPRCRGAALKCDQTTFLAR